VAVGPAIQRWLVLRLPFDPSSFFVCVFWPSSILAVRSSHYGEARTALRCQSDGQFRSQPIFTHRHMILLIRIFGTPTETITQRRQEGDELLAETHCAAHQPTGNNLLSCTIASPTRCGIAHKRGTTTNSVGRVFFCWPR